ncbi:integrase [Pseudomonas sp. JAI115]|uniref:site-specific integrase n=1 Tax=Pseudomonas sp. JAI115 TaxID=2723061 RepID=UPI00160E79EB|nr:site-specific integrase [Pseudomonas sp. JAI115]MBB6157403.1 integrase [Pseudomonas sp. JAI115]
MSAREKLEVPAQILDTLEKFDKSSVKSKRGFIAEFNDERLVVVGHYGMNIAPMAAMSEQTVDGFKSMVTTVGRTGKLSANSIRGQIRCLVKVLRITPTLTFTPDSYAKLIANEDNVTTNKIGNLLITWHSLGIPGVSDEVIDTVHRLHRPYHKSNSRAVAGNIDTGWYSEQEYDDLVSTLWHDYGTGRVSLQNSVATLLNAQYGRRPKQLSYLKNMDFESTGSTFGVSGKRVSFPSVKDEQSGEFRDGKFEVHPMGDDLWDICQLQIKNSIEAFEHFFGKTLSETERGQLPFFLTLHEPALRRRKKLADKYATGDEYYYSLLWHKSSSSMCQILQRKDGSPVFSERTGKLLHEFAYRMRHTRARQLARLGVPRKVLQYWLGHESPISLDSYYDDPAERARTLNNDVGTLLAPLAQAFSGVIRDDESHAIRGDDPTSRIELDGRKGVGTCGESGFCSASVPIPCYRCSKFQPWVYGPHEEVLIRLIDRQEEENNIHLPSKSRRMLAPLQLDKDIRAVKTVIALCEKRKAELGKK